MSIDLLIYDHTTAIELVKNYDYVPNLLSISNPENPTFPTEPANVGHYLSLKFHDIDAPEDGMIHPAMEHIEKIVQWSKSCEEGFVVIHCAAGVSRSTASSLIFLCEQGQSPKQAVDFLYMIKPHCHPNRRLLELYNNQQLIELTARRFWDYWDSFYNSGKQ